MYKIEKFIEIYEKKERRRVLSELDKIHKDIFDFIKTKGLIVFDTFAFEYWLKEFITDLLPIEQYFYSVYSSLPRDHIIELADILYKKGYKILEATKDYDAYVIKYRAYIVIKIFNCPSSLMSLIPTKDCFVPLNMLKIHLLQHFTNPKTSIDRWKELYIYDSLIDKYYPLSIGKISSAPDKKPHKLLKEVKQLLDTIEGVVYIGNYAYLKLLKIADYGNYFPTTTTYEILHKNPSVCLTLLKEKYKNRITVKENRSLLHFHGIKYSIKIDEVKLLDIYDSSEVCVPTISLDNNISDSVAKGTIGNYHLILLYLYIGWWNSYKMKNEVIRNKIGNMINNISCARNHYLKTHKKIGIANFNSTKISKQSDSTPFDIFQIICTGEQRDLQREFKINKWENKISDKMLVIGSYRPEFKKPSVLKTKDKEDSKES